MPRTSLYNLDDILCEAEDIFIEHSYNGAVMDEIIARTEFNRRGFYLEFGRLGPHVCPSKYSTGPYSTL